MHDYGHFVRTRVTLRTNLHLEPTKRQVLERMEQVCARDSKDSVTIDDIQRAYDTGQEVSRAKLFDIHVSYLQPKAISVWCMKCVGYDEKFQYEVFENYSGHI
jgi:hypothetical protein